MGSSRGRSSSGQGSAHRGNVWARLAEPDQGREKRVVGGSWCCCSAGKKTRMGRDHPQRVWWSLSLCWTMFQGVHGRHWSGCGPRQHVYWRELGGCTEIKSSSNN